MGGQHVLVRCANGLITSDPAGLVLSGGFALFLAATRQLLPHDVAYLGVVAS